MAVTVNNSARLKQSRAQAECCCMGWQRIDRVDTSVICWPQSSLRGNAAPVPPSPLAMRGPWHPQRDRVHAMHHGVGVAWRRPEEMGPFGALDIGTPEVKFLDRFGIAQGGGILPEHVRRSRTRVWGAKMIRYRRSLLR